MLEAYEATLSTEDKDHFHNYFIGYVSEYVSLKTVESAIEGFERHRTE